MKPQFIKVPADGSNSFRVTDEVVPYFYNPLHFHPELELTYVMKGRGTRFIGYHVESFSAGDLVLVGPNVPHCWKNDAEYYTGNDDLNAQAIVVQFRENFGGPALFELPELTQIKKLIQDSKRGIKIVGKTRHRIKDQMEELTKQSGVGRITSLLDILEVIAQSPEKSDLTEMDSQRLMPPMQMKRLNDIYQYTLDHFRENISLEEVARAANLTPNAFCRFFKSHNRKSYIHFVNEIRIAHACKLLRNTSISITAVAYESGFGNLAHFNRVFKKYKNTVPFSYRKQQAEL